MSEIDDIGVEVHSTEVCVTDMLQLLTKNGFSNICSKYGRVQNVVIHKRKDENQAYILFDDEASVLNMINNKADLPMFLSVKISNRSINSIHNNVFELIDEDIEKCDEDPSPKKIINEEIVPQDSSFGEPVYFGRTVTPISLVEDSKQFSLKKHFKERHHLDNDDLFGKPLNAELEVMKKLDFELHKINFDCKFKIGKSGELVVEKKLSPCIFVGWISAIDDTYAIDKLDQISTSIENSDVLNIQDLERGMLVGAFDNVSKLYCRGYIIFVAGFSANVALCDIGRVVNTTDIRVLHKSFTDKPACSFKGYTKGKSVQQLEEGKSYAFTIKKESAENTILSLKLDSGTTIKVQLKYWEPTVEESGVPYVHFKSGSLVELLKLKNMESLFIRSREKRQIESFFLAWNNVANYCYSNCEPLEREPLYGEIIGYKSVSSINYVRGRIHKYLGNDVYSVKQMNDPIKEKVKLSEMIGLSYEQKCLPQTFLNVRLERSLPFPIQFEASQFVDLIKGVVLTADFAEASAQGWKIVHLTIKNIRESLNTILYGLVEPLWLKNTTDDFIEEFGDYCTYDHLLIRNMKKNSVETMTFVSMFDGIIYMRDNYFGKSFLLLTEMIREYCSISLLSYLPHNGEVCLGLFKDGDWYRIVCENVKPGRMIQVYFIDLGATAFLTTRQCKKLPRELLFEPTHVYPCYLDLSDEKKSKITTEKLDTLLKYENQDNIKFTVVKKMDAKNSYLIKCPFFEDLLK